MGQWIKCLLNKHEYLYLDSQNPCERPEIVMHISDLSPERDGQVPCTHWPNSPTSVNPRFRDFSFF